MTNDSLYEFVCGVMSSNTCRHNRSIVCKECKEEKEKFDKEMDDYIKHLPFHLPTFEV